MTLFTFVAEHRGSTELDQIEAANVTDAMRRWNLRPGSPRIDPERLEHDAPTPVTGLQRTWCFTGLDAEETLYLVHVIETARSRSASHHPRQP